MGDGGDAGTDPSGGDAVNGADAASDAAAGLGAFGDGVGIGDIGIGIGLGQSIGDMGLADLGLTDLGLDSGTMGLGVGEFGADMLGFDNFNTSANIDLPELVDPTFNISKGLMSIIANTLGIPSGVISGITGVVNNNTGQVGSSTLGMMGGIIGGIPGAIVGSSIGNSLGAIPSMSSSDIAQANMSNSDPSNSGGGKMNLSETLGGLAGLYSSWNTNKALGNQISSLSGMYGQDSPYAQTLRNQLSRRDAAAGRRSQYGPREVELQAKLAGLASQNANAIMQAKMLQQGQQNALLNKLFFLGQKSGLFDKAQQGLSGLFNGTNLTGPTSGGGDNGLYLDMDSFGSGGNFGLGDFGGYGNTGLGMDFGGGYQGGFDLGSIGGSWFGD